MKQTILTLAIAIAFGSALAAPAVDNAAFTTARQQFQAASGGDASARDAAIEAFEKLSASQPGNPVYLAYQGAGIAMRGRDAMMPWEKMKYAEKGADMVQKAVTLLARPTPCSPSPNSCIAAPKASAHCKRPWTRRRWPRPRRRCAPACFRPLRA